MFSMFLLVPSSSIVVERKDDTYWIKRCTCPNHLNLPFLITKLTGSSPNSSLNSAFFFLSFKVTISSCSTQLYLTLLHVPLGMLIFQKFFFLNREFEFPGTRTGVHIETGSIQSQCVPQLCWYEFQEKITVGVAWSWLLHIMGGDE